MNVNVERAEYSWGDERPTVSKIQMFRTDVEAETVIDDLDINDAKTLVRELVAQIGTDWTPAEQKSLYRLIGDISLIQQRFPTLPHLEVTRLLTGS